MNQRITVCIDVDEDDVLWVETELETLRRILKRQNFTVLNWDISVDNIKEEA